MREVNGIVETSSTFYRTIFRGDVARRHANVREGGEERVLTIGRGREGCISQLFAPSSSLSEH